MTVPWLPLNDCVLAASLHHCNCNRNRHCCLTASLPLLPHCCLQVCAPLQQHGVAFGLGVHPWHAHTVEGSGWLQQLRQLLHEYPTAIVGEIGLDKAATTPDTGKCEFEAQLQCFRMQLELAAEMNRAVSVHSVRCHGQMLSMLREIADDLPPAVALHSFTGSSQMVDGLVSTSHLPQYLTLIHHL